MAEKFRRTLLGWVRSSEGYAVRTDGRDLLEIRMHGRKLRVGMDMPFSLDPGLNMTVYVNTIPDTAEWPRAETADRLRRAMEHDGYEVELVDLGEGS